jgi:hypothetical protein
MTDATMEGLLSEYPADTDFVDVLSNLAASMDGSNNNNNNNNPPLATPSLEPEAAVNLDAFPLGQQQPEASQETSLREQQPEASQETSPSGQQQQQQQHRSEATTCHHPSSPGQQVVPPAELDIVHFERLWVEQLTHTEKLLISAHANGLEPGCESSGGGNGSTYVVKVSLSSFEATGRGSSFLKAKEVASGHLLTMLRKLCYTVYEHSMYTDMEDSSVFDQCLQNIHRLPNARRYAFCMPNLTQVEFESMQRRALAAGAEIKMIHMAKTPIVVLSQPLFLLSLLKQLRKSRPTCVYSYLPPRCR